MSFLAYGLTSFTASELSFVQVLREAFREPQGTSVLAYFGLVDTLVIPFSICKGFPNCRDYRKAWLGADALIGISWFRTIDEPAALSNSICGLSPCKTTA